MSFNERQLAVPQDLVLELLDYSNGCLLAISARHGVATAVSHDPAVSIHLPRSVYYSRSSYDGGHDDMQKLSTGELHRDEFT